MNRRLDRFPEAGRALRLAAADGSIGWIFTCSLSFAGKEIQAGIKVDQIFANAIGANTRLPSLQRGCEDGIQGGNCHNGYKRAYSNSISWRTPSTPNPPDIRPRAVFQRLSAAPTSISIPSAAARVKPIIAAAFQTDSTGVITFQIAIEQSNRAYA